MKKCIRACLAALLVCLVPSVWGQISFRAAASGFIGQHNDIEYIGRGSTASAASGSVQCAYPAGWAVGDLLLCVVETKDNVSTTMSGWNTVLTGVNGANHQGKVFWKFAASGDDTTPTVSHSGGNSIIVRMLGFRNVDNSVPSNPFDATATLTHSGSDLTTEVAGLTTVTQGAMLVFTAHIADNNSGITNSSMPAGWTEAFASSTTSGTDSSIEAWYKLVGVPGAQSGFTANRNSTNAISSGGMIALRPGTATAVTVSKPTGTLRNDVMIASVAVTPVTDVVTPPSGWTLIRRTNQNNGGDDGAALLTYYKVATASEPSSYSWYIYDGTNDDGAVAAGIATFTGVDISAPINVEGGNTTGDATTHTANAVTTTVANAMVVASHMMQSAQTWTPPTGMTEAVDRPAFTSITSGSGITLEMSYVTQATAGSTGTKQATAGGSADDGAAHLLALRPQQLFAQYQMEESAWNGTANEVVDSSGNSNHGTAASVSGSGIPTTANASPAYTSAGQSTCRYGQFNTSASPLQTPYIRMNVPASASNVPALPTNFTLTAWVRSTNVSAPGQRIVVNDDNQNGWGFSLGDVGQGRLRMFNRGAQNTGTVTGGSGGGCGVFCLDTNQVIANNNWYFVAASVDTVAKLVVLYVYNSTGTQVAKTTGSFTGTWTNDTGALAIGGEAAGEGVSDAFHFRGNIDEVQIFSTALTEAQVAAELPRVRPCGGSIPEHVEFVHNGDGLTCQPKAITVLGCTTSASCNGVTANQVSALTSFSITPTQIAGAQWCLDSGCSSVISGSATVTNGTTIYLKDLNVRTDRMSGTAGASNATIQCAKTGTSPEFNTTTACDVDFANSGFLITTPNHASCEPQNVTIQAVKANATSTACIPAFAGVKRNLTMYLNYQNPASGTRTASFDYINDASNTTASIAALSTSSSTPSTLTNLYFDSTGTARLQNFRYPDVGQVGLYARYVGSAGTGDAGLVLTEVNNNTFIAAPKSFSVSATGPYVAGGAFTMNATAMNACSTPTATPNFGLETTPETVELKAVTTATVSSGNSQLVGPSGGEVGVLTSGDFTAVACSPTPCTGGTGTVRNTEVKWSEVGDIAIAAVLKDGTYLNSGVTAAWGSASAGPFKPHHLETAIGQPCTNFTYSGQPFQVTVTAMNAANTITKNYAGTYARDVTLGSDSAGACTPDTAGFSNNIFGSSGFSSGTGSTPSVFSTSPLPISYAKSIGIPSLVAVCAKDSDGVNSHGFSQGQLNVRNGRIRLSNANGSELLRLPVPVRVEYYQSAALGWQPNADDTTCSTIQPANFAFVFPSDTLNQLTACETVAASVASPPNPTLTLSAPGVGNTGWADIRLNLGTASGSQCTSGTASPATTAAKPWLRFDWRGTGASDPTARVRFGVYRSGPVIYRRESF